jgi:hypothetical protein
MLREGAEFSGGGGMGGGLAALATARVKRYWEQLVADGEEAVGGEGGEGGQGGRPELGVLGGGGGRDVERSLYHVTLWHSSEHSVDKFDAVGNYYLHRIKLITWHLSHC